MTLGRCPLRIFCSRGTPPDKEEYSRRRRVWDEEGRRGGWVLGYRRWRRVWKSESLLLLSGDTVPCRMTRVTLPEREFFIDNLLVRIHLIIEMILVDRPCAMGV